MLQARCLCTTDFLPCFNEKKSYAIDGTLLGNLGRHSSKEIKDRAYLVLEITLHTTFILLPPPMTFSIKSEPSCCM